MPRLGVSSKASGTPGGKCRSFATPPPKNRNANECFMARVAIRWTLRGGTGGGGGGGFKMRGACPPFTERILRNAKERNYFSEFEGVN